MSPVFYSLLSFSVHLCLYISCPLVILFPRVYAAPEVKDEAEGFEGKKAKRNDIIFPFLLTD